MKTLTFKFLPAYLLLCFLCSGTTIFAQAGKALEYYNAGTKAYGKKKYRAADSLFTLSINLKATTDAYVKRAASRQKLNDKKGACMDLSSAANMGSKDGLVLFREDCSKTDTVYKDAAQNKSDATNFVTKEAIETCELLGSYDYIKYNHKGEILLSYYKSGNDTVFRQGSEMSMPEFPGGGYNKMRDFISKNTNYPSQARENGLSGKVWISFMVNKNGKIEKPAVFKEMKDCPDCDAEALRVVSLMPLWVPAKRHGKAVTFYFRVPFTFKLQ
ncbi:MAG: energy transducer TonB [Bacteroidetes bacterium]|nr:energy transducer TonB [Bacteroidota bacterium]